MSAPPWILAAMPPGMEVGADGRLVLKRVDAPPGYFPSARLRSPEEIERLKAICAVCPSAKNNDCTAQKCCGGKLPLETIWNLNLNHCPLKKF